MSGTVSNKHASRLRGAAFAATAAALFLAGCGKNEPATTPPGGGAGAEAATGSEAGAPADAGDDEAAAAEVKCFGINECSGQSACDVAGSHECGGQNSCKGKGWILVSQSDCDSKGGKVL
jgi:hypothetical protein